MNLDFVRVIGFIWDSWKEPSHVKYMQMCSSVCGMLWHLNKLSYLYVQVLDASHPRISLFLNLHYILWWSQGKQPSTGLWMGTCACPSVPSVSMILHGISLQIMLAVRYRYAALRIFLGIGCWGCGHTDECRVWGYCVIRCVPCVQLEAADEASQLLASHLDGQDSDSDDELLRMWGVNFSCICYSNSQCIECQ
jgi:hypothetical protein